MRFGTIGAGNIAQAVARHAVAAGHDVVISNSREPETLAELAAELGATAGSVEEAAAADIVLLAPPWSAVDDILGALPAWDGRILIDATNAFISFSPTQVADFGDGTSSEHVASLASGAHVIKAFNTLFARFIAADPRHDAGRQLLFYAGDDADAKARFAALVDDFGFAAVDAGSLHEGGKFMQAGGGPLSGLHALKQET
ncbi:NAD(P)-binding domain-containing protein [Solirubrobacter ginsenosidimutans]|uniref:NAD(P)-binding domain-containing protein n=1 Tax=Solirubrobacter ginsenosidimutans TaxID=490573 RepID=A0A9X3N3J7_9ACTN|nr:NAD(P)-binding domain-containing protein [Solirubrobacter ginsenosidimutans]MDA0166428.1 NAD(P)-binding domain-containing protein [Solirubrobacter ginsenosidimutans]